MITREQEKEMIANSDRWPGPHLCLKKRPAPGERAAMGYVAYGVITSSTLPIVIHLRPDFKDGVQYDTIDSLLDDNWIVD